MPIKLKTTLAFICAAALSISCGGGSDDSGPSADIEFSWGSAGLKSYGAPYIVMHLHHEGGDPIYNASCHVKALSGSTIKDTAFFYFADGATISAGQTAEDEGIFFNLSSHSDYDTLQPECDWLYQ